MCSYAERPAVLDKQQTAPDETSIVRALLDEYVTTSSSQRHAGDLRRRMAPPQHDDERMRHAPDAMVPAVSTTDYHTAAERLRMVVDPPVPLPGLTVADPPVRALDSPATQALRGLLRFEQRGHAGRYRGFMLR